MRYTTHSTIKEAWKVAVHCATPASASPITHNMKVILCILCTAILVASDSLTQKERDDVLNYHNAKRSTVVPSAAFMTKMVGPTCTDSFLLTIIIIIVM